MDAGDGTALVLQGEYEQSQADALEHFGVDEIGEDKSTSGEDSTGVGAGVEAGRGLQLRPVRELRGRVPEGGA